MKKSKIFETVGWIIGVAALGLAYAWFGYQLVIVLILSFWGRNLERKAAEHKRKQFTNDYFDEDVSDIDLAAHETNEHLEQ